MRTKSVLKRPKDLVAYLAISSMVVAFTVVAAVYNIHWPWFWKWGLGFGTMTAIVFGYFIQARKSRRKHPSFWAFTAALLSIHVLGFWFVFSRLIEWKPFWFWLAVPELMLFLSLEQALAAHARNRH